MTFCTSGLNRQLKPRRHSRFVYGYLAQSYDFTFISSTLSEEASEDWNMKSERRHSLRLSFSVINACFGSSICILETPGLHVGPIVSQPSKCLKFMTLSITINFTKDERR